MGRVDDCGSLFLASFVGLGTMGPFAFFLYGACKFEDFIVEVGHGSGRMRRNAAVRKKTTVQSELPTVSLSVLQVGD